MTFWVAEQKGSLSSKEDAARLFEDMLERLRFLSPEWFVWDPTRSTHVELREPVQMATRLQDFEVHRVGEWVTYRLGLRSAKGPGPEDGHCLLVLDADPMLSRFVLAIEIDPSISAYEMAPWIASIADDTSIDKISYGEREIVDQEGVGWLTYRRGAPIGPLAETAEMQTLKHGTLIQAHGFEPGCKDEDALLALRAVAKAIGEAAAAPALAVPTYLQAQPAMVSQAPHPSRVVSIPAHVAEPSPIVDQQETAMLPSPHYVKPALPFAGETTPERLAEIAAAAPDTQRAPTVTGQGFDETAMMPSPFAISKAPKTGSFRDQLGPVVVPILSLEEYADLRAELALRGEDHAETLLRFGVTSPAANNALKARFAEYFTREPGAQRAFVEALQARMRKDAAR